PPRSMPAVRRPAPPPPRLAALGDVGDSVPATAIDAALATFKADRNALIYRRLGADLPFTDPRRAHGIAFEGCYWRFAGPSWAVAVICGVCRDARGTWAMVTVCAQPDDFEHTEIADVAWADEHALGVIAGAPGAGAPARLGATAEGLDV